jgi:hypothetical protein
VKISRGERRTILSRGEADFQRLSDESVGDAQLTVSLVVLIVLMGRHAIGR